MRALLRRLLLLALCLLWLDLAQAGAATPDMAERVRPCTQCHGAQGRAGPDGYYPRLAGKPAEYLLHQLQNIREDRRHYRLMQGLIDSLDDASLRAMADYFAGLQLPYAAPHAPQASADTLQRGRRLALEGERARGVPACTECHGQALTGVLPAVPGLLGLPADYLKAQLGGWQTGQRAMPAPDCMATMAQRLGPADSSAVAAWLATQPVPAHAAPAAKPPVRGPKDAGLDCSGDALAGTPALATAADAIAKTADASAAAVARGRYLARIGNCALCHRSPGGMDYAGGRAIATPFGDIYSSNLTPDPVQGIGRWSADDFWQALHRGRAPDGHPLNPAFPYTSYTYLSRADSDDLWAYLQTVPTSPRVNRPHALRWPFGSALALRAWQALFFRPADAPPALAAATPEQALRQRGAYLVEGLGHCLECHGARNALGALRDANSPGGQVLPGSQWLAPSLRDPAGAWMGDWGVDEIQAFLRTGRNARAIASGPMAEVVRHSTQYLSDADADAMAAYLKALPRQAEPRRDAAAPTAQTTRQLGARIYDRHCADCHGAQGEGRAGGYPALASNRAVVRELPNNLINSVLQGGYAPATAGQPVPLGMPPFVLQLNDAEIAAVLSYVRTSWGNQAGAISEFDINKFRRSRAP